MSFILLHTRKVRLTETQNFSIYSREETKRLSDATAVVALGAETRFRAFFSLPLSGDTEAKKDDDFDRHARKDDDDDYGRP